MILLFGHPRFGRCLCIGRSSEGAVVIIAANLYKFNSQLCFLLLVLYLHLRHLGREVENFGVLLSDKLRLLCKPFLFRL